MPKGDMYFWGHILQAGERLGNSVTFTGECCVRNYTQGSVNFADPVENQGLVLHIL